MSAPRSLRIAIAGAGFAGLAAATLLARSGHRVRVFEKFREPRSIGAGILLQPTGLAALRLLGIESEVLRHGSRIEKLDGRARFGWPVVRLRYRDWQAGAYGLGVHRGVLFDALWSASQRAGAYVETGRDIRDLADLRRRNDVVVIADGCRSSLRGQTGLACVDRVYPWGAMWAVLKDPVRGRGDALRQWYRGGRQMLGLMPTGMPPGQGGASPVVSLFWSLHADRHAAFVDAGLDAFKRDVLALHPDCAGLLDQLTSMDQLTWARYHDVVMPAYHADNCVVIGDAAHATSPQLGQGTNLALLDAVALDACLQKATQVPDALAAYTQTRKAHLHFYADASRRLTPAFQSDAWGLPLLRDLFMAGASRLPVARRLTMETLVGVRQAWWRGESMPVAGAEPAMPAPTVSAA